MNWMQIAIFFRMFHVKHGFCCLTPAFCCLTLAFVFKHGFNHPSRLCHRTFACQIYTATLTACLGFGACCGGENAGTTLLPDKIFTKRRCADLFRALWLLPDFLLFGVLAGEKRDKSVFWGKKPLVSRETSVFS